jgi:hypothetical protein
MLAILTSGHMATANIERSVIDRVLLESGATCFVKSSTTLVGPLSNRPLSALAAGEELRDSPTLMGSLPQTVNTLGGELLGERPGEAWVLTKLRGQVAGVQLRRGTTSAGVETWTYVDTIMPADCTDQAGN